MTTWRKQRRPSTRPAAKLSNDWLPCQHCGQPAYTSRAVARDVLRQARARQGAGAGQQLRTYRCQGNPNTWHVGPVATPGPNLNDPALRFDDQDVRS